MPELSLLEFSVYGFVTYSSLLMLIISTIKEVPATRSHSIARSIYLIPGIICSFILASSGVNVVTETVNTNNTIVNLNTTEVFTETYNTDRFFVLQNPVWVSVHFLFAAVMVIYVVNQLVSMFTRTD